VSAEVPCEMKLCFGDDTSLFKDAGFSNQLKPKTCMKHRLRRQLDDGAVTEGFNAVAQVVKIILEILGGGGVIF
jgi:hypothetical protein